MDNMRLLLRDIVKMKQIASAGPGDTDDCIGLREQLPLAFDDGRCIREQLRKPFMDAVVMGDHDTPPAHPGKSPVQCRVVDVDPSPKRRDDGGEQFVDCVAG